MKQTSVILLLILLLLPIIWNGVTLFHYVVEHTHTFCQTEAEHAHATPDDCLAIFQLAENHNQNQLPAPVKSEFKELKQYLNPNLDFIPIGVLPFQQVNFVDIALPDNGFTKDFFHPPIFA